MSVDLAKAIRAIAPNADKRFVSAAAQVLPRVLVRHDLRNTKRQVHFLAQTAHESAGFRIFEERLSYTATRLMQVWPSRFRTLAAARPYARNPRALANLVYGGRMGNTAPDHGWIYRGRGALMHTGRAEYERVERRTRHPVVAKPDLLADLVRVEAMLDAAVSYFVDRGCLPAADADDTIAVTRKINGGTIGLADRIELTRRARAALALPIDAPAASATAPTKPTQAERHHAAAKAAQNAAGTGGVATGGAGGLTAVADFDWSIVLGASLAVAVIALATFLVLRARARRLEPPPRFLQFVNAGG